MSEFDDLLAQVRSGQAPAPKQPVVTDEYSSLLQQVRQPQSNSIVQSTAYNASLGNPDDAAERKRLADQLKAKANEDWAPTALDPKDAKRRVSLLDSTPVLDNSPALSNRFLTQDFAARTIDDIPQLGHVESTTTKLKNMHLDIPVAGTQYQYDPLGGLRAVLGVLGHAGASIAQGYAGLSGAMNRAQGALLSPILGEDNFLTKMGEEQLGFAQTAGQVGTAAQEFAGAGEGAGYGKRMLFGAGSNVTQVLALGLPMALEKAVAVEAAPAAESILGKLTANFTKANALAVTPMALNVVGQEATTAYEQGMGPYATLGYAGGQGAIEAITEMLPFGLLARDIKMDAPILKILRNQLISENLSEQVATHTQDLLSWSMLPENKDKTFGDYLAERPSAALDTLVQTTIATVLQTSAVKALHDKSVREMSQGQRAVYGEQNLNEVIDAVQATKSHQRNAEDVKDLMDDIGAGDIHIDARTAAQILNQSQLQTLVSDQDLQTALQTQGDIVVPASQFAMAVASDESMRPIVEHVRVNPELPSAAEAREVETKRQEMIKQQGEISAESEKILADAQTEKEFVDSASELESTIHGQIKATGQYLPEASKAYSKSVQAFYVTKAKELGMKPMDLYKLLPYNVTTGSFEQQQVLSQEEYIRKNVGERVKELTQAAQQLERGEITQEQYDAIQQQYKPVLPYQSVPMPETEEAMRSALKEDQQSKLLAPRQLEEGAPVGLRLDIPAYLRHNTWVVSVHEQKPGTAPSSFQAGTVVGYDNVAAVTNATFGMPGKGALNIATGKTAKGTIAVIKGNWRKVTPEQAKAEADAALSDPAWRQVGMDPERHAYFYDRETMQPVVAADEVIQIGPLVLAKNVTYGNKGDYLYQGAVPQSIDAISNIESAFQFAAGQQFNTNRDFKVALQRRLLAAANEADIDLNDFTTDVEQYLVRVALADALTALQTNPNAIGWYNEKVTKALRLVSLIHPEIATDKKAKFAFTWALAVTSNGLKVDKNFALAENAYSVFKQTGKMPTNLQAGQAQIAINKSLGLYNELIDKYGFDKVEEFFTTKTTVKEVQQFTGLKVNGENLTTQVYGAAALGPKIGNGFFANLYGHFEQLTMDRWLMRTWGRWTGTLVEENIEQTAKKQALIKSLIAGMSQEDRLAFEKIIKKSLDSEDMDAIALAITKASMKPENRIKMAMIGKADDAAQELFTSIMGAAKKGQERLSFGDEMRKAGNALSKYLDGQKEAPSGPPERARIRKVMSQALDSLQQKYPSLTMSDLQALLWYPEKRLYDSAKTSDEGVTGYEDDEAPDYANAAAGLAREKGVSEDLIRKTIEDVDNELSAIAAERAAGAERNIGAGGIQGAISQAGILKQTAPVWKSVLLESVQTAKIEKAPGNDWLNILKKSAKADEIEATDLAEFLEDRASVSKQEIVDYLNSNGVEVQETTLVGDIEFAANDIVREFGYRASYEYGDMTFDDYQGNTFDLDELDIPEVYKEELAALELAKFESYAFPTEGTVLPGGYKEILLRLPLTKPTVVEVKGQGTYYKYYNLVHPDGSFVLDPITDMPLEFESKYAAINSDEYKAYGTNRDMSFTSSHWDEKNVLAHIRLSEVKNADGSKTLFVEEIQSDWGQEGRKLGFKDVENWGQIYSPLLMKRRDLVAQISAIEQTYQPGDEGLDTRLTLLNNELETVSQELKAINRQYLLRPGSDVRLEEVPVIKGPFVQDTKAWSGLAVKRLMRYAADHGYAKVAFINGQQAAERFKLREQVEYLSYDPQKKWLRAWNKSRTEVVNRRDVEPHQLDNLVGKEVAKRLLEAEPTFGGLHLLEGEQLEIGGEGMIGYYNGILPQVVSKIVGKFGAKPQLEDIGLPIHPRRNQGAGPQQQMVVDITPEMRTELKKPQPLFQQTEGVRGGFDPSTLTTIITKQSDMSTFLHETGHFYLEAMFRMAALPNATEQMKADAQTVLDWFGVTNLETWNSMSLEDQRKYHEQWAYNHEIYLYEGKAPSLKLQSIFDKFSAWLRQVYKSIVTDLNAIYRQQHGEDLPILTGEVRQVMDRLMASDDQIAQAEEVRNMKPIFQTQEESGMDDAQWAEYQDLQTQSHDSSVSDLTKSTLRQMKWLSNARSKLLKAMQAKVNDVRKGVRVEAAKEVEARPVYRAIRFLRTGKLEDENGNPIEVQNGNKLNKGMVKAMYPEGALVPGPDMGKLRGMLSDDGLPPDMVAEIFGFTSGDDMVRAIAEAKPINQAIDDRTDERMLNEHSELMDPEVQARNIEQALHTEARARFVAVELRYLAKATQPVRVMLQAAKMAAQQIISGKKIKDIKPRDYSLAEARAAKKAEAHMKKGESKEAAQEKQGQLLQGQLAAEAVAARGEVEAALAKFKKFFRADKKIAKTRDMDLVNAARAILSAFGIGPKGKSPFDFVDQLRTYNPDLYAELEPLMFKAASGAVDYKQLTMEEFRAMKDAVDALWFNAKRDKQIMVEGQAVDLANVITQLNERMTQVGIPAEVAGERKAPTKMDRLVRAFNNTKAILRRVEHWADSLDGEAGPGAFTKFIWRPVKDALNAYRLARNDYVKRYAEMIQDLDLPVGIIEAPELGYSFGHGNGGIGKAELLGAILHTGNESNYKKLLVGRGWGVIREDGSLDTGRWDAFMARMIKEGHLTKKDFDFAQQVWDLNEEIKPLAQKAHHDMFGYYFKEVPNTPFSNQFGSYRGGYVPAKTDPFIVRDAQRQSKMEALESDFRNAMPSTGLGFTKGRVEYNKPLSLDVRQMTNHIDSVIRFALVQPAIKDALKILRNRGFADNLSRLDPSAIEDMLIPWLNRAARQITSEVGKSKFMDDIWRGIRQRTGIAIMFGNLRNALQQLTGYFPAAIKVKPGYLKSALASYMSNTQAVTEEVAELSPFMKDRLQNQIFDIQENMNDILLNPSKFDKLKKWTQQHGYFLQTAFQNQVDVVTWTATYNQTLAELGSDVSDEKAKNEAVQRADAAVRLTQSSLSAEDLAAFEVGTPFTKTLTHFGGYMNMMANLNVTAFTKVVRDLGWRGNKGKLLYVYLLGIALPALIGDAIMRSLGTGWDDDDDDGYLDEFMAWFFGSQGKMVTGMVPFAGQLATATYGALTTQQYDDKISISPSITALESAGGTIKAGINVASSDKELTGKNVRDVMTFLSLVTGVPMTVLGRPIGYAVDVNRGAVQPTSTYDLGRGLVTGVPSKESTGQ